MRLLAFIIIAFAAVICMAACQKNKKYMTVDSNEFERIISNDSVQLLDVRTEVEYSEGHIHHALNINVLNENFEKAAREILEKDKPVAVYCRSGRRSLDAADKLEKLGFKVYNLDNGIQGWTNSGREIEK